ncbi:exodeoxyribonuclease VII large subunit [Congzhengia minquanensis]|uniref:Exodeoxyribonuclease 7 large subunit n=1 Tax=Congzhengia minquanensis TaxID=2763657 RepID=A0A926DL04_9FIRM|nr:exodeoxyribonuclease VII large subunit [Congzhengia minquanensis]MBC8539662.1 exodeoxyribonuclease VII large subunit [Congzhengia minquanensis]
MEREILTVSVSQLNNYIKRVLDANSYLGDICVKGELSNFKLHSSGHIYASLKDEGSLIKLVMFRSCVQRLTFRPDNGMKVTVRGRISVYERDGVYQIYAEDIVPDGVGSLYAAYEKLKAQLDAEGLFDEKFKKPLPPFPQRIGVVTAKTGAAVRDIINITGRRFPMAEVFLAPVSVQGVSAAPEIANAIRLLNEHELCDVMIVGRGGGSIEDLWAFNEEIVARAIFASHIPVVSAVGHETDFTIADFVADLRAPTPSAAAELVCPSAAELSGYFQNQRGRLKSALIYCIEHKKKTLANLTGAYGFQRFSGRLADERQYVDALMKNAEKAARSLLEKKRTVLSQAAAKLDALSPLKTLARGYSIASTKDGTLISSVSDVKKEQEFVLRLSDGAADCKFL